jgi:2',3'-cyclic-nucleotide 2'-phosphodiesterase (5'-nucleotidase family)
MHRLTNRLAALAGLAGLAATAGATDPAFILTVLHHSDGESQLISLPAPNEDFGGVARFATVVDNLKAEALTDPGDGIPRGVVLLTSGDNFLAGPEFQASLDNGVPYFDSIALDLIGYDALIAGNHEFDFGPDILENFLLGFTSPVPLLSANLDVSAEPGLTGKLVPSTMFTINGFDVAIVGATTEQLNSISFPRDVVVNAVLPAVQAEVASVTAAGADIVILSAHLQQVTQDYDLLAQLTGVDVAIAGGGGELFANPGDLLIPGDTPFADVGPMGGTGYPRMAPDMNGNAVPVISVSGDYGYVGRLVVEFDADGNVMGVRPESGPVRVSGTGADAVDPRQDIVDQVITPLSGLLDAVEVAQTEVPLDGTRASIRSKETNQGNLIADAYLNAARNAASIVGAEAPIVTVTNGGGIRNDSVIPVGVLTGIDVQGILAFNNEVTIVEGVTPEIMKALMENGYSAVNNTIGGSGRFSQISGMRVKYDSRRTPRETNDLTGVVEEEGDRIREIVLNDGRVIVRDGQVVSGAPTITIATGNFIAGGGDEYPFDGTVAIPTGVGEQDALTDYLVSTLGGVVSPLDYPEGGENRVVDIAQALAGDFNGDGIITFADVAGFLAAFDAGDLAADINGDGMLTFADVAEFVAALQA